MLLARWLVTEPRLLILDEPTRGIDVGAKAEIQRLVAELADDGMSVLFISAELEEVLRLSHRVAVLRDRQVVAELANDEDADDGPPRQHDRERRRVMTPAPICSGRCSCSSRCCVADVFFTPRSSR